jgi:hypothetical protein
MTMPARTDNRRSIAVVSAVMKKDGFPDLVLNEVFATQEEIDNGMHYYFVEAELLQAGFEEPFVHFADGESPSFLHPAVREYLGLSPAVDEPIILTFPEKT